MHGAPAPYGFHTEAIILWLSEMPHREIYRHVWVVELDVEFSGPNFSAMLRSYDDKVDFITLNCRSIDGWPHQYWTSDAYLLAMRNTTRARTIEAVQRFSHRYLRYLEARGMHAWSEEVGCSFAAKVNLSTTKLRESDVGFPFDWIAASEVTADDVKRFWNDSSCKNRLYHPVKV